MLNPLEMLVLIACLGLTAVLAHTIHEQCKNNIELKEVNLEDNETTEDCFVYSNYC